MRKRGTSFDFSRLTFTKKYLSGRPINSKKLADIKKLMKFIPPVHHEFYSSPTAENIGADSDSEHMDNDENTD